MVTICVNEQRQNEGKMLFEFKSYIFGGLVKTEGGQLFATNDLYEVCSKSMTTTKSPMEAGNREKKFKRFDDLEIAEITKVSCKG